MATAHDFADSMLCVAPAGGATIGTIVNLSTATKVVVLPTVSSSGATASAATVASGATFIGRHFGLCKSVPKLSGTAWVAGQPLLWSTATTQFDVATSGTVVVANSWGPAASTATTGDVILSMPHHVP